MKGQCLCTAVQFEIEGNLPNLYQCHCSLCRKATGSAANAAIFVQQQNVRWLSGQDRITSFQKPSGFRSDFCAVCGSPVPNPLRGTELVWIPVGLLDDGFDAAVKVHLHLDSAAPWARDAENCLRMGGGPESLDALYRALKETND